MTDPRFMRRVMPEAVTDLSKVDRQVVEAIRERQEEELRKRVAAHIEEKQAAPARLAAHRAKRAAQRRRRELAVAALIWTAIVAAGSLVGWAAYRIFQGPGW